MRDRTPGAWQAEGQQLVVPAFAAAQPQEAVGQDAALQEGVELVFDEPRQLSPGAGLGVGNEAGCVLLDQAVQRGLFRAMPLVVQRGAVRRPLGLLADGLHARLPCWLARTVSSPVRCRNRPIGRLPVGACLRMPTFGLLTPRRRQLQRAR